MPIASLAPDLRHRSGVAYFARMLTALTLSLPACTGHRAEQTQGSGGVSPGERVQTRRRAPRLAKAMPVVTARQSPRGWPPPERPARPVSLAEVMLGRPM